uniref:Uncharacterized protein n=1 Tax=Myoviridae sp. ctp7F23 TaxID=2825174 RepID=A0A8S5U8K2_9CAUD|nr:MAG TPA: hypothetical protein [Myoviridae sp. ctp7F23]
MSCRSKKMYFLLIRLPLFWPERLGRQTLYL